MKDWFDKQAIFCMKCKHKWMIVSNKTITREQYKKWISKYIKQHEEIHENL